MWFLPLSQLKSCRISPQNPIDNLQCGVLLSHRDFLTSLVVADSCCQVHLCFDSGNTICLMRFKTLQAVFSIHPYTHLQQPGCPHCLVVGLTLLECKQAWSCKSSTRIQTVTISRHIIETLLLAYVSHRSSTAVTLDYGWCHTVKHGTLEEGFSKCVWTQCSWFIFQLLTVKLKLFLMQTPELKLHIEIRQICKSRHVHPEVIMHKLTVTYGFFHYTPKINTVEIQGLILKK